VGVYSNSFLPSDAEQGDHRQNICRQGHIKTRSYEILKDSTDHPSYVGTRSAGNVYALQDTNQDGRVDRKYTLLTDGNMPNGVAYKDGDLYVAEVNRILKYEDIESNLAQPGEPIVINDSYPTETHHGWKYIAFGNHYGYPYCHQGDVLDPEFGIGKNCSDYTKPFSKMGPHTAPLGCDFYDGSNFPVSYSNNIFVCRHGSWNRKEKIGYDVVYVDVDNDNTVRPFVTGWLSDDKKEVWGRPVDIELMPDGSMLISDDYADAIYRVYYQP